MSSRPGSDFAGLTRTGKLRRVGRLADAAVRRYDIEVRSIRMHCFATNLLYRVRADTGERFMLRMAYPGWRTLDNLLAEAAWLDALSDETDVGAPVVVRSSDGSSVIPMSGPGVPDTWHATLMTWVDGRLLAHHLTCSNIERMGELFARLHTHGKAWKPPRGFPAHRFDAFLSRGEPNVLFSASVMDALRDDDRRGFLLACELVEREYARLNEGDLRVIHCDLWHENIKLDHGRLRPFDFEDTIWGYRLHDIAMGMLDLLETVGAARYGVMLSAFRSGYELLLDWPEGGLEVLQLGRLLWKANYIARFEREQIGSTARKLGKVFRTFGSNGELRLPE